MIDEVEEIMDESETFNPKEYMKKYNIIPMLSFIPKLYEDRIRNKAEKVYIQFCFYKGEWVLAGFKDGDGSLGTIPTLRDYYSNALFMKTVTDTEIGNNIDINNRSNLAYTLEAKLIREGLKEFFDVVSLTGSNPLQAHRSAGWFVKGVKK